MLWSFALIGVATLCFAVLWSLWVWLLRSSDTSGSLAEAMTALGPWLPWLGLLVAIGVGLALVFFVLGPPWSP